MENLHFHSKNNPSAVVQRQRAVSDPRNRLTSARPPPPSHPPPCGPDPSLSGSMSECRVPNSLHMTDSRSKTLPTGHPVPRMTTKYGTPLPTRPAPPPPHKKASPKHQITPTPKSRNSSIPKPISMPVSKLPATKEAVDERYPVYEDVDKDDNHYEILYPSSSSEDKNEPATSTQEEPSSSRETPPTLPPKKGSRIRKEELPPLPPQSHPVTNIRRHQPLTNHNKGDDRNYSDKEETVQGTGLYEVSDDEYDDINQPQG